MRHAVGSDVCTNISSLLYIIYSKQIGIRLPLLLAAPVKRIR